MAPKPAPKKNPFGKPGSMTGPNMARLPKPPTSGKAQQIGDAAAAAAEQLDPAKKAPLWNPSRGVDSMSYQEWVDRHPALSGAKERTLHEGHEYSQSAEGGKAFADANGGAEAVAKMDPAPPKQHVEGAPVGGTWAQFKASHAGANDHAYLAALWSKANGRELNAKMKEAARRHSGSSSTVAKHPPLTPKSEVDRGPGRERPHGAGKFDAGMIAQIRELFNGRKLGNGDGSPFKLAVPPSQNSSDEKSKAASQQIDKIASNLKGGKKYGRV